MLWNVALTEALRNVAGIQCKRCLDGQLFQEVVKEIMISLLDRLECKYKFCYLGDFWFRFKMDMYRFLCNERLIICGYFSTLN